MSKILCLLIVVLSFSPMLGKYFVRMDFLNTEQTTSKFRPRIGPMASINFMSMDYFTHIDYSRKIRMEYPEKFRGFSLGIMGEIPLPKHEKIFSITADASLDYMPTFQIEKHFVEGSSYEIHNEFTNVMASLNGGMMVRLVDTGLKVGAGVGVNYVYSRIYSTVTLDSIVREEIANEQITVIEYKPDRKTAEVKSQYDFIPKPFRIPIYFQVGFEFQNEKFSLFPYFRFNYSIFAQGTFSSLDYTVTAYQAGISLMLPLK